MKIITIISLILAAVVIYLLVISILKVARDPRNTKINRIKIATGGEGFYTFKVAGKKIQARNKKEAYEVHFTELKKWRKD